LSRDVSGDRLATSLGRYGHANSRQGFSHMRLPSTVCGGESRITVPPHVVLNARTLRSIVSEVAVYLELSKDDLIEYLVGH